MKAKKLNFVIVLGLIATIGILVAQLLWMQEAFSLEQKKFSQRVHIALLEVVKNLYQGTSSDLPSENPIQKIANDFYIVNVENDFKPEILEFYLKSEFMKFNIATDFEYAMYNCESDEMVYGNYVSMSNKVRSKATVYFPKHKNFVYYFAVRFPNKNSFLLSSMRFWFVLSLLLIIILLVYVYSIYTIIQQKKYADIQRDFINNMTHEFKTPLSSILIASNFLKSQSAIASNKKLNQYNTIIINQGNILNGHIEKVLTVAKSDDTKFAIITKEILIIPILNDVIETIQLKYPQSKINIVSTTDYNIQADVFHFSNVVYNLIDNAIKYCDVPPEITIDLFKEGSVVNLNFTDNGIGIDKRYLPFIFDKFYRISTLKSDTIAGFGLGLYYVKKIVSLHKWKIIVLNSSKGTSFSILIPDGK